ncbi:MAG: DUF4062 domain-containing protein, partial [Actinomycetota bacterium]|nr:DUF4062 domain-containing protein [Actinomycetota bacterium]
MTEGSRSVRVFVSSTFRDMIAERNELATHAWPALRTLCEARAATFTDVDLRWGITDEQVAEGRVLPICLAEIDSSRPYFIGILGDRYGWIPNDIPDHLVEQMPWLAEHRSHSITELEIVHGVLNDPDMATRAYFYFRDSPAAADSSAECGAQLESEDPTSAARLAELKNRIRATAGVHVRENYRSPAELTQWVIDDITEAIDATFPAEERPDALAQARLVHEAHALARRGVYVGRSNYFEALDMHVASDNQPLVITGQSGSGKSALLANWVRHHRQHSDAPLIEHYCAAVGAGADWEAMCRRLAGELAVAMGIGVELPESSNDLSTAFKQLLPELCASRPAVVIIDGLNHLEDRKAALDLAWLPSTVPVNLRLILSTLPGRPLEETRRRGWPELNVEPLTAEERLQVVVDYLGSFSKTLSEALAHRIAEAPQSSNPLFIRMLLDELRVVAGHEDLADTIERYLTVNEVDDLLEKVLERWERDYQPDDEPE